MKTRKATGGLCAETRSNNGHGSWQSLSAWVSAQPAPTCHCLSFPSLPPSPLTHFSPSPFLCPLTPALLAPHYLQPNTHPPSTSPLPPIPLSARIFRPLFLSNLPLASSTPSFSLRGCSSRCTLTARGYCEWKCSCWTRRPLQSTGQRLVYLCLRLTTFDLQLALHTCHRG